MERTHLDCRDEWSGSMKVNVNNSIAITKKSWKGFVSVFTTFTHEVSIKSGSFAKNPPLHR